MAQIVQMEKAEPTKQVPLTNVEKAQIAAQIAAIIRASFRPLADSDVRDVLRLAASQLVAASPAEE